MTNYNKKESPVIFNKMGLDPVSATYVMEIDDFKKVAYGAVEGYIDTISDLTCEITYRGKGNERRAEVCLVAWFKSDGKHFKDDSTKNSALGKSLDKQSDTYRNFVQKLGYRLRDDDPSAPDKIVQDNLQNTNDAISGRRLRGVRLSLVSLINIMFDRSGRQYQNEFKETQQEVVINASFPLSSDGKAQYIKIEKRLKNVSLRYEQPSSQKRVHF